MHQVDNCLLCGSPDIENISDLRDVSHWKCPNCHEVLISGTATVTMQKHQPDFWLLSAYFRKQSKLNLSIEMLHSENFKELINKIKKPKNINEAKSRIIEFYGDNSDLMGSFIKFDVSMFLDIIIQKSELDYLLYNLWEQGIIETNYEPIQIDGGYNFDLIRLSPEGWDLYDEIKTNPVDSNKVLIAMWFNEDTNNLRESLKSAIIASGYDPMIVDERHFTGNIIDYIIGQIKQSKFLIADFTVRPEEKSEGENSPDELENVRIKNGTRGGVYYEAGFAKGLGLEVIHTCKNNNISKNRLHFDIVQDNTLFWNDEDVAENNVRTINERVDNASPINFSEIVFDRIISIFGFGDNVQKI